MAIDIQIIQLIFKLFNRYAKVQPKSQCLFVSTQSATSSAQTQCNINNNNKEDNNRPPPPPNLSPPQPINCRCEFCRSSMISAVGRPWCRRRRAGDDACWPLPLATETFCRCVAAGGGGRGRGRSCDCARRCRVAGGAARPSCVPGYGRDGAARGQGRLCCRAAAWCRARSAGRCGRACLTGSGSSRGRCPERYQRHRR